MPHDLESRVAVLEEAMQALTARLLKRAEIELKQAREERRVLGMKEESINRRYRLLDDMLIRIENLEEVVPPPQSEG